MIGQLWSIKSNIEKLRVALQDRGGDFTLLGEVIKELR
jgi:hypothetical protein